MFAFVPNVFFWQESFNYWTIPDGTKPLLHTWSLGVEEQFYILFPLVLFLLVKYLNKHVLKALVILWVISFALNVHLIFKHQPLVFYMLPFRAWELLTGSILAIYQAKYPSSARAYSFLPLPLRVGGNVAGIAGLLLVCVSVVWLGYARKSHFPGTLALMPVMGAFLCISAGGSGVAGRLLSWKPFVHIGKLSYSMYLWHWVLITFWKYAVDRALSVFAIIVLILAIYILSLLSYRFIEQPVRKKRVLVNKNTLFRVATAICLITICGSVARQIYNKPYLDIYENYNFANGILPDTIKRYHVIAHSFENRDDDKPVILLMGDSHAGGLLRIFNTLAEYYDKKIDFFECGGNILGTYQPLNYRDERVIKCHNKLEETIKADNITDFVIVARLALHTYGLTDYEAQLKDDNGQELIYITDSGLIGLPALEYGLKYTIDLVKKEHPNARIWIQTAPEMNFDVGDIVYRKGLKGEAKMDRKIYDDRQSGLISALKRFDVRLILPAERICDAKYCYAVLDDVAMYMDTNHITLDGHIKLRELYEPIFANH